MSKGFSSDYCLVKLLTYIIVLWIICRYFLKRLFSPHGFSWYVVFIGVSILSLTIGYTDWKTVLNRGPQTTLADEFMEYTPLDNGNVSTFEEILIHGQEPSNQEENNTEYDLSSAPAEPIYAYSEPEPEQSYSQYQLPEAPLDPIIAYPKPQTEQYSSYGLPTSPETPTYAYQSSPYEESSSIVDLPPAEDIPVYAYQEPIYSDPPMVADMPEAHSDITVPADPIAHQAMPAESVMIMETNTPNHQSSMNMDNMPMPDYSQMNGNGAVAMDTHQMTNNSLTTDNPSHTYMTQPQMSDHSTLPSTIALNSNHQVEMPGMDQTPGIHQIIMPSGHIENVMIGHSGSGMMTIPPMSHDQMVNMNLGHAENHGTTHITSNNDHSYMNMTNTQLTMPSNHHVAGTNQPMTDHSGMVMTSSNMLTVPTTNHTDHTSNPTANPIQPTISHLATHTSTPTFGTGTPSTTHHEIATANPTYNAFHNSHLTAPVTSTTHDQHTLAATNPTSNQMTDHGHTTTSAPNNVITSDTHNGHPTPTSNNIVTSATHNSHTMSAQNITPVTSTESINNHQHNIKQTPMVISSNQINIKELPKTGVSSLILLGLTTIISLLYLKKRSRQIEIMTANGLWTQMQLNKSINK